MPPTEAPPAPVAATEDDGLGPTTVESLTPEQEALRHEGVDPEFMPTAEELVDVNSYYRTSVPGGAQPQDEGFYTVPDSGSAVASPPTPPADLPNDGDAEEEKDPLLFLLGNKQLGVKVGGRKPDASVLKVKGGKIELEGQFDRGDRFPAVFDLQVTGDGDRDSIELETGTIKSTRKTQEATVCGTSTLAAYLARKLEDHPGLFGQVTEALGLEIE